MTDERKSLFWFCLLLAAALIAYYWPWMSGQWCYYSSDHTYYFEPICRFMAEALNKGRLPMWNPLAFCGMSQIAIPSPSIGYPPTWLLIWFAYSQGLAIYLAGHQLLAGAGGFLLVSSWGWGPVPAAACGLILALTGYMFSFSSNFTLVATAAWLPAGLWALRQIQGGNDANNHKFVVIAGGCVFMLLAAGRPELSVPAILLMVAYSVGTAVASYKLDRLGRRALITLMWRGYAVLAGILVAMPVLVPALQWASVSPRGQGLRTSEVFLWSTNWYDLLCLVFAQPFGDLYTFGNKFLNLAAARPGFFPFLASAYLGPVAFTLAIWGALDRTWRSRLLLFSVLVPSLVLAVGSCTPIAPWLISHVSLLAVFRYPIKLVIVPVWCIAILAARGVYLCMGRGVGVGAQLAAWFTWLATLAISLTLTLSPEISWLFNKSADLLVLKRAGYQIGVAGLKAAAIGLGVCGLLVLLHKGKLSRNVFATFVLPALAGSMLSCAFLFTRQGTEPNFFLHDSYVAGKIQQLLKQQPEDKGFRIVHVYLDPLEQPQWYQGQGAENREARFFQYGRQLLLPNIFMDYKICSADGYESSETSRYKLLYFGCLRRSAANDEKHHGGSEVSGPKSDIPLARFCQMTSSGFVLTQAFRSRGQPVPLLDPASFTLAVDDRSLNVRIYRVKDPLPRLYLPHSWGIEASADSLRERMVRADLDGFDPSKLSLLLKDDHPGGPPVQAESADFSSRFLRNDPEHLSWAVNLKHPAMLVLADQYYPGWNARIDGKLTHTYCANLVQRAVLVNEGSHTLTFDYEPDSLAEGLILAAVGVVMLKGLAVIVLVRTLRGSVVAEKTGIMNKWQ